MTDYEKLAFKSFDEIFNFLAEDISCHIIGSKEYDIAADAIRRFVHSSDLKEAENNIDLGVFGYVNFGYFEMGNITSLDLFGIDELIIFSIYKKLAGNFEFALDLGANIGLHSLLMSRLGWRVRSYEPDPVHVERFMHNINLNNQESLIELIPKAVWIDDVGVEFTRVVGNTTGNHITGAKKPYGELESFFVETANFRDIVSDAKLIKLDVEGVEGQLFGALRDGDLSDDTIMVMEVSKSSRVEIYQFAERNGFKLFCQKDGWKAAVEAHDLPTSHKEGSVLLSKRKIIG